MSTGGSIAVAVGFRLALTTAAATLTACTSVAVSERSLDGTRWHVAAVNGRATPPGDQYHLRFDEGRIGAQFGCNGIGGTYSIHGQTLVAHELISTLIGCPEPAATFETQGSAVLNQPMRLNWTSETQLTLSNAAGSIRLERR